MCIRDSVKIDEKTLKDVAHETGGLYFRAKDEIELEKIYDEINKMERSKIKIKDYTMFSELFSFISYKSSGSLS